MINRSLIVVLIITLASCSQRNKSEGSIELFLEHHPIPTLNGYIAKAGMLRTSEKFLISHDIYSTDLLLTKVDLQSLQVIDEFGQIGGGPEEISTSGFYSVNKNTEELYLYDAGRREIVFFDLNSPHDQFVTYKIPNDAPMIMDFARINDEEFVSQNFINPEQYSYCLFNIKTDSIIFFGDPYFADEEIVMRDYYNQYYSFFTSHPDTTLFVRAFKNYDLIQILNLDGKVISEFEGKNYSLLSNLNEDIGHYTIIRATSKYIFADYLGGPRMNDYSTFNRPKIIRVFDWDLNLIKILVLDKEIVSFDIDRTKNRLFVYTSDESKPIVYYDLNEANF